MAYHPPKSREELLTRYAAGERSFVGAELDLDMVPGGSIDLSGEILDGADFSECWFTGSFRNASLRGATFRNANVKCCDFTGADLTNADFTDAAMEAATWRDAILNGTKFGDPSLYGVRLTEAQFLEMIADER